MTREEWERALYRYHEDSDGSEPLRAHDAEQRATIERLRRVIEAIEERTRPNGDMADAAVNALAKEALR